MSNLSFDSSLTAEDMEFMRKRGILPPAEPETKTELPFRFGWIAWMGLGIALWALIEVAVWGIYKVLFG